MSSDDNLGQDPRLENILLALTHVGTLIEKQAQQQAASSSGNGGHLTGLVEQFLKLKPPRFAGIGNPKAAESGVDKMEKIFALLDCNDIDKVTLA